MRELRTQESKKFEKFFEIIRKEAVEEETVSFFAIVEKEENSSKMTWKAKT